MAPREPDDRGVESSRKSGGETRSEVESPVVPSPYEWMQLTGRAARLFDVNAPVSVYQRSAVIAAQWVPVREPACTNLAGYIANHPAGQQYSGYWQPSEVQQADQQVTTP